MDHQQTALKGFPLQKPLYKLKPNVTSNSILPILTHLKPQNACASAIKHAACIHAYHCYCQTISGNIMLHAASYNVDGQSFQITFFYLFEVKSHVFVF